MLASQVGGCFVLTAQRSKLVAATQKVRTSLLHSCDTPIKGGGGAFVFVFVFFLFFFVLRCLSKEELG